MTYHLTFDESIVGFPSSVLLDRCRELGVKRLFISSLEEDLQELRDYDIVVPENHKARVELSWTDDKVEFATSASGRYVDDAISESINTFWNHYPTGKIDVKA